MDDRHATRRVWLGLAAGLALCAVTAPRAGASLTADQVNDYLVWLHSLESTLAARAATGQAEHRSLFPAGLATAAADTTQGPDLAAVVAALEEVEGRPRVLQEPASRQPLHALGRARSYASIAEFDSALVWYDEALRRDTTGEYADEFGREAMAAAIAAGDSVAVTRRFLRVLGGRDLAAHAAELELAYRYFVSRGDATNLDLLVRSAATQPDALRGRLAYWQAFALSWLGRHAESLEALAALLVSDGVSFGLDEAQRAWVLVAVPDLLLLSGDSESAETLYRALAASSVPGAADWAACQVAAIEFLAGRFLAAGTAFERLCQQTADLEWREYACKMAALSGEMERLRDEGELHGAAAYDQR
ncbi:MAG TPA: hypothetical protein PLL30_07685 [Candidatus Krumholzibacteria bacterium]|nr:hypothetical protein [Candidatus Krumholzibacteria bacterium]HPD71637.1 hypothetical protein [Candidatus Krumholzibacteria bacterium]HRY41430.1 hypothetical protein [Candidatus Krumholzibacteria bacterium]